MKFDELNLDEEVLAGIAAAGFETCTEVQAKAIPHVLDGSDVMVQSQTGTGKTAAFLLPTFHLLRNKPELKGSSALVIAPTRELAVQIKEEADVLGENLGLRTEVFHGGVGYGPQTDALADGVDVIVGTPGRMLDLSQSGKLHFKDVSIVIVDEADRLFDMGFYPDIRRMFQRMRPREERINMLFSATLSTKARNIAWEHMNNPVEIEVQPEHVTVDRVTQTLYHVASEDKMSVMLGILRQRKPRTAIVFTNTKRAAEEVAKRLEINGYPSEFIIGDLPQRKRQQIIQRIKAGEAEFLVATDVAARGLHINDLDMVINYDLPEDPEAYVHRIGRTARAGESGQAVTLACQRYVFGLDSIESLIRQKIPVEGLSDELYGEDASAGMRIRTGDSRGGRDNDRDRRGGDRDRRGRDRDRARGRNDERQPQEAAARSDSTERDRPDHDSRGPSRDDRGRGGSRRGGSQRGGQRGGSRKPRAAASGGAPKAGDSLEERLAYYREKYGEDFQPTDEMLANMSGSGGKRSGGKQSSGRTSSGRKSSGRKPQNRKPDDRRSDARSQADAARADQSPRDQGSSSGDEKTGADRKKPGKGILGGLRSLFGGKGD